MFYPLFFASRRFSGWPTRWMGGMPAAADQPGGESAHRHLPLASPCPTQRAARGVTHLLHIYAMTMPDPPGHQAAARAHNRMIWRDVQRSRPTMTTANIRRSVCLTKKYVWRPLTVRDGRDPR